MSTASRQVLPITDPASRSSVPWFLWLFSTVFIVYGTTIPFHFIGDWSIAASNLSKVSTNPFIASDTGLFSLFDFAQNTLLFVPFGVFGVWALRRGAPWTRVLAATVLGALLSLSVETLQLFTLDRDAAIADVLANTLGTLAGALVSRRAGVTVARSIVVARREGWATAPATYPALIALMILVMSALQPFNLTLDTESIWWKFQLFLAFPWQFRGLSDEPLDALRYAIAAAALAAWCRQVGLRAWAIRAAAACAFLAIALEAGQLFVESRMPGLADVAAALAGVGVGTAVVSVLPRRHVEAVAFWAIVSGTIAGAAVLCLSQALSDPFQLTLAFVPLGFVLGARTQRPSRAVSVAAGVALLVSGVLAFLQASSAQRGVDVVGIGAAAFGSACGAWAASGGWAMFRRMSVG